MREGATKPFDAKAQAVVEGDVNTSYVVYKSVLLVRRDTHNMWMSSCTLVKVVYGQYTQQQLLFLGAVCGLVLLASCAEYNLLWRWQQQQRVVIGMQRYVFINHLQFSFSMHIASIKPICFPRLLLLLFFAAKQTVNCSSAAFICTGYTRAGPCLGQ